MHVTTLKAYKSSAIVKIREYIYASVGNCNEGGGCYKAWLKNERALIKDTG